MIHKFDRDCTATCVHLYTNGNINRFPNYMFEAQILQYDEDKH